eukprot:1158831-Pelagomonas_calceolata.AAC.3
MTTQQKSCLSNNEIKSEYASALKHAVHSKNTSTPVTSEHSHTWTHPVQEASLHPDLLFFPAMPPNTVSGIVTRPQMMMTMTMVPKGRAAVDCAQQSRGPRQNSEDDSKKKCGKKPDA